MITSTHDSFSARWHNIKQYNMFQVISSCLLISRPIRAPVGALNPKLSILHHHLGCNPALPPNLVSFFLHSLSPSGVSSPFHFSLLTFTCMHACMHAYIHTYIHTSFIVAGDSKLNDSPDINVNVSNVHMLDYDCCITNNNHNPTCYNTTFDNFVFPSKNDSSPYWITL